MKKIITIFVARELRKFIRKSAIVKGKLAYYDNIDHLTSDQRVRRAKLMLKSNYYDEIINRDHLRLELLQS